MTDDQNSDLCPDCGQDHDKEWKENLPHWALIDKAFEWVKSTNSTQEIVPDSLVMYFKMVCDDQMHDDLVRMGQMGVPVPKMPAVYAAKMMLTGFAMGVALSESVELGERIPNITITDEERDEFVAEQNRLLEEQKNAPQIDKTEMVEVLKRAGLVPEDFDGNIEITTVDLSESASGKHAKGVEDLSPGNYL